MQEYVGKQGEEVEIWIVLKVTLMAVVRVWIRMMNLQVALMCRRFQMVHQYNYNCIYVYVEIIKYNTYWCHILLLF